jgi:outer membrane protein OmpA-like peptidoglycan-associated protein
MLRRNLLTSVAALAVSVVVACGSPPRQRSFRVYFEFGEKSLSVEGRAELDQAAAAIRDQAARAKIIGHTAKDESNDVQKLGQDRAHAVKAYLEKKGIPEDQLSASSRGDQRLLVPSKPRDKRNCRVEIELL